MNFKRENLLVVIEAFGVISAAAFVLSALINAAIFWFLWKINYFLVASPTDVVMSGFMVVGVFLIFCALVSGLLWLLAQIARRVNFAALTKGILESTIENVIKLATTATAVAITVSATHLIADAMDVVRKQSDRTTELVLNVVNEARGKDRVATGGVAGSTNLTPEQEAKIRNEIRKALSVSTFEQNEQIGYPTGLRISSLSAVDELCKGAPILWIGSGAAIAACRDKVRIFHKLDPIITEPPV